MLEAYQTQLRARDEDIVPDGAWSERDGPLLRTVGRTDRGFVEYRDLGGLEGAELDELIARQVAYFAGRGEPFEWKHHGHDLPADLTQRLLAHGFVPEPQETVLVARVADVAAEPRVPEGVRLIEVSDDAGLERLDLWERGAWESREVHISKLLRRLLEAGPDAMRVIAAEAGGEVLCAAWIRFERGTEFATLWGGATLPAWRGRGIYRAVVVYRAQLAAARGFRYLEVDASDESRPILERLGFVAITTTTPYIWSPPS